MGWNTSAIFLKGLDVESALRILPDVLYYKPTSEQVDWETATGGLHSDTLFVRQGNGVVELWDPDQRFPPRIELLVEDSCIDLAGTTVLAVLFAGVKSTYAFWLYEGGRLVRHATFASGTVTASEGEPLEVESRVSVPSWGHDESFLLAVIDAVCGCGNDESARYERYEVSASPT